MGLDDALREERERRAADVRAVEQAKAEIAEVAAQFARMAAGVAKASPVGYVEREYRQVGWFRKRDGRGFDRWHGLGVSGYFVRSGYDNTCLAILVDGRVVIAADEGELEASVVDRVDGKVIQTAMWGYDGETGFKGLRDYFGPEATGHWAVAYWQEWPAKLSTMCAQWLADRT